MNGGNRSLKFIGFFAVRFHVLGGGFYFSEGKASGVSFSPRTSPDEFGRGRGRGDLFKFLRCTHSSSELDGKRTSCKGARGKRRFAGRGGLRRSVDLFSKKKN